MRRAFRAARASRGALATLCLAVAFGAAWHQRAGAAVGAWSPWTPARTESPFRLGSAARPFAWSTAIGDLNADGRPDYAVADRVGHDAAGFEYELELSVSGRASQSVTFNSPEAALSITLRDVDHDQDLDIVVSPVLSPNVARVWLNDGEGRFAETADRELSSGWNAAPSVAADADVAAATLSDVSRRRAGGALRPIPGSITGLERGSVVASAAAGDLLASCSRLSGARAPPPPAAFSL
jgi:hypothetical protein